MQGLHGTLVLDLGFQGWKRPDAAGLLNAQQHMTMTLNFPPKQRFVVRWAPTITTTLFSYSWGSVCLGSADRELIPSVLPRYRAVASEEVARYHTIFCLI